MILPPNVFIVGSDPIVIRSDITSGLGIVIIGLDIIVVGSQFPCDPVRAIARLICNHCCCEKTTQIHDDAVEVYDAPWCPASTIVDDDPGRGSVPHGATNVGIGGGTRTTMVAISRAPAAISKIRTLGIRAQFSGNFLVLHFRCLFILTGPLVGRKTQWFEFPPTGGALDLVYHGGEGRSESTGKARRNLIDLGLIWNPEASKIILTTQ